MLGMGSYPNPTGMWAYLGCKRGFIVQLPSSGSGATGGSHADRMEVGDGCGTPAVRIYSSDSKAVMGAGY